MVSNARILQNAPLALQNEAASQAENGNPAKAAPQHDTWKPMSAQAVTLVSDRKIEWQQCPAQLPFSDSAAKGGPPPFVQKISYRSFRQLAL
jgi:hypothetical protein